MDGRNAERVYNGLISLVNIAANQLSSIEYRGKQRRVTINLNSGKIVRNFNF